MEVTMATGFSSDSGNSGDDGSLGAGLDDSDDDILSQFRSPKKFTSRVKDFPGRGSKESPKPSPRNLTGGPSLPKAAYRNIQPEIPSKKSRSPSPEQSHALQKDARSPKLLKKGKERGSRPPVPRPRTSSLSDSQSPRSLEPSPRERPKPSPRLSSSDKTQETRKERSSHQKDVATTGSRSRSPSPRHFSSDKTGRISPGSKELDDLLGTIKESPQKSTVDDLFVELSSSSQKKAQSPPCPQKKKRTVSHAPKSVTLPSNSGTETNSKLSTRDGRSKSPLSALIEGKGNFGSREPQDLDDLFSINSRRTGSEQQNGDKTGARSLSPSPKSGKLSPTVQMSKKKDRKKGQHISDSDVDEEVADTFKKGHHNSSKGKVHSKSPNILDLFDGGSRGSPSVEQRTRTGPTGRTSESPTHGKKSPTVGSRTANESPLSSGKSPAIQGSSSKDKRNSSNGLHSGQQEKTVRKGTTIEVKKKDVPKARFSAPPVENRRNGKMSPLEKLIVESEGPKKTLLDSDSEDSVADRTRQRSPKASLLDVLDESLPDRNEGKRKKVIPLDTEDEHEHPTVKFTDRRPKGGYQSDVDSDLEAELAKAKQRVLKPSPVRPPSGHRGCSSRYSLSSTHTLSSENMNTLDSTSIREVMYGTWRARKTKELKSRKKLEKKKMEAERKKEENEAKEKRLEATATFDAWKGQKKSSLVAKKREAEEKERKKKEEQEEKMNQKVFAEKAYESWKREKDERIKQEKRKEGRMEQEKMMTLREKEEEQQTDAEKAFATWNADKEKSLKAEARVKHERERELQYTKEVELQEKEENGMKAYEEWEEEMEKRRARQRKQLKNTKPISPYPFRPSSNTVPFGR